MPSWYVGADVEVSVWKLVHSHGWKGEGGGISRPGASQRLGSCWDARVPVDNKSVAKTGERHLASIGSWALSGADGTEQASHERHPITVTGGGLNEANWCPGLFGDWLTLMFGKLSSGRKVRIKLVEGALGDECAGFNRPVQELSWRSWRYG